MSRKYLKNVQRAVNRQPGSRAKDSWADTKEQNTTTQHKKNKNTPKYEKHKNTKSPNRDAKEKMRIFSQWTDSKPAVNRQPGFRREDS